VGYVLRNEIYQPYCVYKLSFFYCTCPPFFSKKKQKNAGGRAYTPIDLTASNAVGREVLSSNAYSAFYDNYFRMDLKAGYTINSAKRKLSQTISLDIQNVTNHKNVFSQSYNGGSKSIQTTYQLGLFPNVVYKVQL
jgi:hypothetical protein